MEASSNLSDIQTKTYFAFGEGHRKFGSLLNEEESPNSRTIYSSTTIVQCEVDSNGIKVTLEFDDQHTSVFYAPWLWSNDPSNIQSSSKNKLQSPASYYHCGSPKIVRVSIRSASQIQRLMKKISDIVVPIPPPSPGTAHPIAAYGEETQHQFYSPDQSLLQVEWKLETGIKYSFYDLNWLIHWSKACKSSNEVQSSSIHAILEYKNEPNCIGGVPVFEFESILPQDPFRKERQSKQDSHAKIPNLSVFCNPEGVRQVLQAVFQKGAVLIRGVPEPESFHNVGLDGTEVAVAALGKALSGGKLSHGTLYGDIFHVISGEGNANNVAYTSVELKVHQDLAYYESPPGLQLLHCVEFCNQVVGGESTLIDGLAAAREFRQVCPQHFEVLSQVQATFIKQRPLANMTFRRPHIVVDPGNNEIITVNWAPPFEGPLVCHPSLVEPYYQAYYAFDAIINRYSEDVATSPTIRQLQSFVKQSLWEYRMQPGEILVFNNRRMLHGRNEFHTMNGSPPKRHLVGCYTNIDDTLNRYRVLQQKFDQDHELVSVSIPNVGNGTSLV